MIRRLAIAILNAIVNPIFIVSAFGPTLIAVNMLWIRSGLSQGDPILGILLDVRAEAVREYGTQLYTLFLAALLFQVVAVRWVWKTFRHASDSALTGNHTGQILWLVALGVQLVGFLFLFSSGILAGPWIVQQYMPQEVASRLHAPPMCSPITWLRGVVIILAVSHGVIEKANSNIDANVT